MACKLTMYLLKFPASLIHDVVHGPLRTKQRMELHGGRQLRCARACAGRIMDFVESGKLVLTGVKFFVLDEADRLLDTGNQQTIMKLFGRFPKAGQGVARLQVFPENNL